MVKKAPIQAEAVQKEQAAEGAEMAAAEMAGDIAVAAAVANAQRERSDKPLTAEELAKLQTKSGKPLTLEKSPLTPAAYQAIQEQLEKDGVRPDPDGVRRDTRLWDMFRARARNESKQLDISVAKEVYEARLRLRAEAKTRYARQKDESAPTDKEGKVECRACGRSFVPMIENLVIGGKVQTFVQDGLELPKLVGNFVVAKYADEQYVPTAMCNLCLKEYRDSNRGTGLDTNGYAFSRAELLCQRINEREGREAKRQGNLSEIAKGAAQRPKGTWRGSGHIR